jgi:HEAT repeat protein
VTSEAVLVAAVVAVTLVCLSLAATIIATKAGRSRSARRRAALISPFRGALIAVASGEDCAGAGQRALAQAPEPVRGGVDLAVVDLLGKVRGEPAERLVAVLDAHGQLERARAHIEHRSPVRRARAVHVLGLSGDPEHRPLVESALADHAPEVRAAAAHALGLIGDPAAASAVLAAVGDPGGIPAGIAADALLDLGIGISDALREGLASPDARTRAVAAHVSGVGAFSKSATALRRLLASDPDESVRLTAAGALGSMGRSEDAAALAAHVSADQPAPLRRACAEALGALGDVSAVPVLAGLLAEPDLRLAEVSAEALVCLGGPGIEALRDSEQEAAAGALAMASLRAGSR